MLAEAHKKRYKDVHYNTDLLKENGHNIVSFNRRMYKL